MSLLLPVVGGLQAVSDLPGLTDITLSCLHLSPGISLGLTLCPNFSPCSVT